jgi:hypothetical protein
MIMKELVHTFRPSKLAEIAGQPEAVKAFSGLLKHPSSRAFILSGEPGTGKTSCAYALAAELGCDAFGSEAQRVSTGFWIVPSNRQGVDALDEVFEHCRYRPLCGSLWWVVLLEESECKSRQAVNYLKTRLELLPTKTIVIFTTNSKVEDFADPAIAERCTCLRFNSDADKLWDEAQGLVDRVWMESLHHNHSPKLEDLGFSRRGRLSFRAVLRAVEPLILAETPEEIEPDAPPVVPVASEPEPMPEVAALPAMEAAPSLPGPVAEPVFTLAPPKVWTVGDEVVTELKVHGEPIRGRIKERRADGMYRVNGFYFSERELRAA